MSEGAAIRALADAARAFAQLKPRRNVNLSGPYGRVLSQLLDAARLFSTKSDGQWAADLIAEREACALQLDAAADDADQRAVGWDNRGSDEMAAAKRQSALDLREQAKAIRARGAA